MSKLFWRVHLSIRRLSVGTPARGPQCWPHPHQGMMDVQRSHFLNGIKVACANTLGTQLAACSILFQAGSRYEEDTEIGANHFVRVCCGSSGCGYTSFAKMRSLQQKGIYITCSSNRETITFTMTCPPCYFTNYKYYLLDTAIRCKYNDWDIDDRRFLVRDELTSMRPESRVLDLVQRACWSGPLANSVYCARGRIDSMNGDYLRNFVSNKFTPYRCTVASVGVPFEDVIKMAEGIDYSVMAETDDKKRKLSGAQNRKRKLEKEKNIKRLTTPQQHFFAAESWKLLKYNVLASACGTGYVQRGQHAADSTQHAPLGRLAKKHPGTLYRAFNISYLDKGIFGILIKSHPSSAHDAVLKAEEFLHSLGDMEFDEFEVGKRRLKLSLCTNEEDSARLSEALALQELGCERLDRAELAIAAIDALQLEDISITAQKITAKCSKLAIAVVGDAGTVPLDIVKG